MDKAGTLRFRVALSRQVYREIEIAASASLYAFAEAITGAYGFNFDHAFGFYSKIGDDYFRSPERYELFADMGEAEPGARSVTKSRVAQVFAADKAKMLFLFDYGDEWRFKVERLGAGSKEKGVRYPRIVKSTGEAPEQYPEWEED